MTDRAWIPLAEIARPHGVRGEVRLKLFNKTSDTLLALDEVLVRMPDGEEHEVSVEKARRADDAILMKLYSIDDRDRADELRGALVCARRSDFPPVEDGEFYTVDIVGGEVQLGGKRIGTVKDIVTYPAASSLVVDADDGEGDIEVPLMSAFVANVDAASRVVTLVTIEDLPRAPAKKKQKA